MSVVGVTTDELVKAWKSEEMINGIMRGGSNVKEVDTYDDHEEKFSRARLNRFVGMDSKLSTPAKKTTPYFIDLKMSSNQRLFV